MMTSRLRLKQFTVHAIITESTLTLYSYREILV
jgi:hypothetical protein